MSVAQLFVARFVDLAGWADPPAQRANARRR
jgi:hypothetical protein